MLSRRAPGLYLARPSAGARCFPKLSPQKLHNGKRSSGPPESDSYFGNKFEASRRWRALDMPLAPNTGGTTRTEICNAHYPVPVSNGDPAAQPSSQDFHTHTTPGTETMHCLGKQHDYTPNGQSGSVRTEEHNKDAISATIRPGMPISSERRTRGSGIRTASGGCSSRQPRKGTLHHFDETIRGPSLGPLR